MGLGDEIMVTGRARVLQQTDPRKVRVIYRGQQRWSPIFDHNPRIAGMSERGDFQELRAFGTDNNRPYHTGKTLTQWSYNLAFRPDIGELYFSDQERDFGLRHPGLIIIEPHIKPGASPNKQWGIERWHALSQAMRSAGLTPVQIGPSGTRCLPCVDLVETPSFRHACAVIANARACVLPEGGLHHAAAALNVPAVVIFGGFTPVELTGYPMHRNLGVSLGDACGMRVSCPHCAEEMGRIKPVQVLEHLRALLK